MSYTTTGTVRCDMVRTCSAPVTYLDDGGFVYCTTHGKQRQAHRRCRKLRPHEQRRVASGQLVTRY